MSRGDAVHVRTKPAASGLLSVVVDDHDGFTADTVSITLKKTVGSKIEAEATVEWSKDFGPPFRGTYPDPTGSVQISSNDWSGATPLWMRFDLRGQDSSGSPWCDHGFVALSR